MLIKSSVTAAGVVLDKPFLDTTWEEGAKVLEVNVSQVKRRFDDPESLINNPAGFGKLLRGSIGCEAYA
jgi:hypothetical protein